MREGDNERVSDPESLASKYDQLASMYDEFRDLFDVAEVMAGLHAHLPARGSLLDLGCGAGHPVAAAFNCARLVLRWSRGQSGPSRVRLSSG